MRIILFLILCAHVMSAQTYRKDTIRLNAALIAKNSSQVTVVSPTDIDNDGNVETTVEGAIQAIDDIIDDLLEIHDLDSLYASGSTINMYDSKNDRVFSVDVCEVLKTCVPPDANVFMTNPDAASGVFDASYSFLQLGGTVPNGECVNIDVILIDPLTGQEYVWETLTGLLGDNISTFTSTETTANFSITDHSTGVVGHGLTTLTDKRSWAFASGNSGLNASRVIFEVKIGGNCVGNVGSILPLSVNLDNRDNSCNVYALGIEVGNFRDPEVIVDSVRFFSPLASNANGSVGGLIEISVPISRVFNTCNPIRIVVPLGQGRVYALSSITAGGQNISLDKSIKVTAASGVFSENSMTEGLNSLSQYGNLGVVDITSLNLFSHCVEMFDPALAIYQPSCSNSDIISQFTYTIDGGVDYVKVVTPEITSLRF